MTDKAVETLEDVRRKKRAAAREIYEKAKEAAWDTYIETLTEIERELK